MHSIEVKGEWFGVQIPEWLRAFDCRSNDLSSPYWGSERAQVDMGLGSGWDSHATTPHSCSTYTDSRKCSEAELRRQVADMVKTATGLYEEWLNATCSKGSGKGGSCLYWPVAITMSNYGWAIIADKRTEKVKAFRS